MALQIFNSKDYQKKLKVTIHASGKLGFSDETAKTLKLSPDKYISIAMDDENDQFYLAVLKNPNDTAFKVCAAGRYFYLNTVQLFKELDLDYTSSTIIFDLKRDSQYDEIMGGDTYAMTKRSIERKKEGGKTM